MNWSDDIENILENIRINSKNLSEHHKRCYYTYKNMLKYFKIPIIILTSITSVISVGLSTYIPQNNVSLATCLLSLSSALIGSVELYLGIQKNMEQHLESSKEYLILAYDIYKVTKLDREHRIEEPQAFLNECFNEYVKYVEQSNLVNNKKLNDQLAPVPTELKLGSVSSTNELIDETSTNESKV